MIEALTEGDGSVEIERLEASFSLAELMTRIGEDEELVASFLYYMGLLTLEPAAARWRFKVPNLVIRKLLLDRLLEIYLAEPSDYRATKKAARAFLDGGDLGELLSRIESKLLPILSNRDQGAPARGPGGGINETTLRTRRQRST